MSVHFDRSRGRWMVRWREDGRQRVRRFDDQGAALRFDAEIAARRPPREVLECRRVAGLEARVVDQGGVYPYETSAGSRWRIVYRQSDGVSTTRRGFESRSAAIAARRAVVEQVRRGEVRASRETFAEFWAKVLEAKRPYVTEGTLQDYATQGRLRLLPWFGKFKLAAIDEDRVRAWLTEMAALVAAGELSAKTVNNSRTCLAMTLNEAVRRGHLAFNPCRYVPELPVERVELDYLRLDEIERYLDACVDHYRPLAELLIGTGARISEALGVLWPDLDLDARVVQISRQRARGADGTVPTKGRRFRSVQIGPRLSATLGGLRDERRASGTDDDGWLFVCPPPLRGRYSGRTRPEPPSRKTAHDWHEWALQDAGLRDMPLHALRHTAATAWLASGHPLIFVQRQLGHRSITTTEEHYGHLESSFVRAAAARTEALIAASGSGVRS
jgi:integrase